MRDKPPLDQTCFVATAVVLAVAALLAASAGAARQETKRSIWDGVYSAAQAERGATAYRQECSGCHAPDLFGDGMAPALVGSSFYLRWRANSVGDMFDAIRTSMPQAAPDSLGAQAYVDIIGYLLQANKAPAGQSDLPAEREQLDRIVITEKPPQDRADARQP